VDLLLRLTGCEGLHSDGSSNVAPARLTIAAVNVVTGAMRYGGHFPFGRRRERFGSTLCRLDHRGPGRTGESSIRVARVQQPPLRCVQNFTRLVPSCVQRIWFR